MERSADVVVTLLAVVKAGGAYVPLHPGLPPARMRWIAEQTRARTLVTDPTYAGHDLSTHLHTLLIHTEPPTGTETGETVQEDDLGETPAAGNPGLAIGADRLAYVMFTSGSTGVPKGVAVTTTTSPPSPPTTAGTTATACCRTPRSPSTPPPTRYGCRYSTAEPWSSPRPAHSTHRR